MYQEIKDLRALLATCKEEHEVKSRIMRNLERKEKNVDWERMDRKQMLLVSELKCDNVAHVARLQGRIDVIESIVNSLELEDMQEEFNQEEELGNDLDELLRLLKRL